MLNPLGVLMSLLMIDVTFQPDRNDVWMLACLLFQFVQNMRLQAHDKHIVHVQSHDKHSVHVQSRDRLAVHV